MQIEIKTLEAIYIRLFEVFRRVNKIAKSDG